MVSGRLTSTLKVKDSLAWSPAPVRVRIISCKRFRQRGGGWSLCHLLGFIDENEWSGFETRPVVCSDWNILYSGTAKQTFIGL